MRTIAIIGSRRRSDVVTVRQIVAALPPNVKVISGGAKGPDTFAIAEARARGLPHAEILPDMAGAKTYPDRVKRYYERNQKLIDQADEVIALVAPDRKGGTEDTLRRAMAKGIPVRLA